MKKRNFISIALIAACIGAFLGYRAFDGIRTDSKAPVISMTDSEILEVSIRDPKSTLLTGVTAEDNRDGDVTGSMVVERIRLTDPDGTISISFAAFDRSGNVSKGQRTARYTDYESPKFSLSAPLTAIVNTNVNLMANLHATDMFDGDITHRIRTTTDSDSTLTVTGTHNIHLSVTNSLGETAELTLPLEVYPAGIYNARVSLTQYLVYLKVGDSFNPRSYLREFTYANLTTPIGGVLPSTMELEISGEVNTKVPGVYAVDYIVSNTYASGYTRLIAVVEE